ncbi:SCO6880 family protein [Cellulomonas sp. URHE0023]|uniref:SCO6880 family protein n=1 Tax=Cellulomonas sp. URHE0023 TaxID=1380354 RepID=UPI000488DA9D|nr:SCO6880 family protein [Cellulomonas sp. URHE0023]
MLLGLTAAQLALVAAAATVAVAVVYTAGAAGLVAAAPVWVLLLVAGTVSVGGRPVASWVPLLAQWKARQLIGSTTAVASTRGQRDGLRLPGMANPMDLVACEALGAVLLVDRRAGTATAVVRTAGSGFVLDDFGSQEHKVAGWARVLAGMCQQPSIVRVQLMMRTTPGGLAPARTWWRQHCGAPTGELATALAGILDAGFWRPHVRDTLLAVAVRLPHTRRRLSDADVAVVAKQLESVATSLAAAGVTTDGWLDRADLAGVVRSAYDPDAAGRADLACASGLVGPVGIREQWSRLRTDTAAHATYWVAEWPRQEVQPAFLQPLLLGEATARTLTVSAEPVGTGKALREIRRAKAEHVADAAQRARIGQIETEATRAEIADLDRRESELVAGHGDLRFTGLITVSAPDVATLDERTAAMESAAAQAMCDVRRLVGQQGHAHLAAMLPLARGVL